MNIARFVSRLSLPRLGPVSPQGALGLWAPGLWAQVLKAPCRTIMTGKDGVRFGNVGGKPKDSSRDLDIYLGTWVHDPRIDQDQEEANRLMSPVEMDMKTYVSFTRNNGIWKVEQGFFPKPRTITFEFKMGEAFWMSYPDNTFVKILIYYDENCLMWGFYPAEAPQDCIRVNTQIKDYKLHWKTYYPDGTVSTKFYQKE